jgi:trehalose 6-phosphate synthase
MPLEERRERHAALLANVREQDVHHWRQSFLRVLADVSQYASPAEAA